MRYYTQVLVYVYFGCTRAHDIFYCKRLNYDLRVLMYYYYYYHITREQSSYL